MDQDFRILERISWFIKLRWIAISGVISAVFFSTRLFKIPLAVIPLYSVALFLILYNSFFSLFLAHLKRVSPERVIPANILANIQISLDLVSLALLLHFSGGLENPFIFYFIFHMIIAGILLTPRAALLQASFAIILFFLIVFLEYKRIIPHYCLEGSASCMLSRDPIHIYGILFVFVSTMYIAVYMASSISTELKRKEHSLEEANTQLQEKDRIKSEYVLRVTHDIKEHLSAIYSCIDPVVSGFTGALLEGQKDLLSRAKDRANKLLLFVKALLEITRLKLTEKLKKESFSLLESIRVIAQEMGPRAENKGVSFVQDIDSSVGDITGVKVYLEEAIQNLLSNAIKYTPMGGRISFTVKDRGDAYIIKVEDTGIGIPEKDIPHVFEDFFRAENAKKIEKNGTGLGLSITKEVIELHKGRISVESREGKGTAFSIELPK